MEGKDRQRKSSCSFLSIFNIFKSKKQRGGYYDDGMKAPKIWPSDEDRGRWGVADPAIDFKAEAFIAENKKRVSSQSD